MHEVPMSESYNKRLSINNTAINKKIHKVLDSWMIWESIQCGDQNIGAKYLKHYLKIQSPAISACLSQCTSLNTCKSRNIPWNFCVWWTMHTRHESLCLTKPVWLLIYIANFKSNQNWFSSIQGPSFKRSRAKKW